MVPPRVYDVHIFAVIRRQVPPISAASPTEAFAAAVNHSAFGRWLDQFDDAQTIGEFADEFSHYLVDVAGDPEFAESRWFQSVHSPGIRLFQEMIAWDDQGRDPDAWTDLLARVRQLLAETV